LTELLDLSEKLHQEDILIIDFYHTFIVTTFKFNLE